MIEKQWVAVPRPQSGQLVAHSVGKIVQKESKTGSSSPVIGTVLVGLTTGVGGYLLGKSHGHKEGYNQAKIEDSSAIQELEQALQQANTALYKAYGTINNRRQEGEQQLQETQRLRSENEVLKALVHEHPTSAQTEAILKALRRVEFHLTELLPPQFEVGGDGQNPELN